jgi:anhydro-N-acetylmuramic acid kinase
MVLGLMSGTSLDGIDGAIVETDGEKIISFGASAHLPYSPSLRHQLQQAIQTPSQEAETWAAEQITQAHLEIISTLRRKQPIDLIGFHGQTILHAPERGISKQIGSAEVIARTTGIDVVADFRQADIKAGGQGAPLAPLYHLALVQKARMAQPIAVINIGGIANITYIDEEKNDLIAFDTGSGNGLLDDWINRHLGLPFDEGGAVAAQGKVDEAALTGFMHENYFSKPPPKSLDRHSFSLDRVSGLSVENGAATLLAFTTHSIAAAQHFLPRKPKSWIICGGGRHNKTLLSSLESALDSNVVIAEKVGWQGDMIEAQCFAFLAMRSVRGLALSVPTTTGCSQDSTGGVFVPAK